MTVREYYETHTTYSPEDEQRLLKHYEYVSIPYDGYLRVAKHRDGRYFVVDFNGDQGIDDTNAAIEEIITEWYSKAN